MSEQVIEGRRERRKRELRARIYTEAMELFMNQGFDNTTVEQIAEASDVVPATFFNHFQNKNAVLAEMTSQVVDHLQVLLEERVTATASTRERLMGFVDEAIDGIVGSRGIARDVLLEFLRAESKPGEPAPYLARIHEPFEKMIREGQERAEVVDDQEASFLAEMVVGMLNAPVAHWLSDATYPIEQRLPEAGRFAWESIRVPRAPS